MRLVDRLYDWISLGPTPDCDQILAAALTHAEPAWSERIIRVLLGRGHSASWAALIGRYSALAPDIRDQLHERPDRMQTGIALALKSFSPDVRVNALHALDAHPSPRMAYVLPHAIRDPTPRVRNLASQVLRRLVDDFLEQPSPAARTDDTLPSARETSRHQLALAIQEALGAFDLHRRPEVLEVALWFARDLGNALWKQLCARRSRAGAVAGENLLAWNSPRLAHFLVCALGRPEWRDRAARRLRNWKTAEQVSALLHESALLDDAEIRDHLNAVQNPKWFTECEGELEPELRTLAPRWVCHAGYRDTDRTDLLTRWLDGDDPRVHEAVVYALAEADTPSARALLKRVGASDSAHAAFARWSTLALDTDLVRSKAVNSPASEGENGNEGQAMNAPAFESDRFEEADAHCTMLWQACRRTQPSARGDLIAALRDHAEVWSPRLRSLLRSPDPRDRILVLQIVGIERLAPRFRCDLEPLRDDPIEGIRELAGTLLDSLASPASPARPRPAAATRSQQLALDPPTRDVARRELRTALEQLSTGAAGAADADLIARVRDLLREVYSEEIEAAPAGAGPGEEGP